MTAGSQPVEVYISHAPVKADQELLEELETQLDVLCQLNLISIWDRNKIGAGAETEQEALAKLQAARLVLFLISSDSLSSKSSAKKELDIALELYKQNRTRLVPVVWRPCQWELYPGLAELSPVPKDKRPLYTLRKAKQEQALSDFVEWVANFAREQAPISPSPVLEPPAPGRWAGRGAKEPVAPPGGEPRAPAVATIESITFNLPALPGYYLEREADLAALRKLLLETGAVGVTGSGKIGVQGMGGIGKSVLAAAVLADEAVRAKYPDGIFWLAVGQEPDLQALQARLGAALGDTRPYTDVGKGREQLNELLKDKACLVALDDVWEDWHARYLGFSPGPNGALLVTTRKRDVVERLGAKEYRVEVLPPEQALELLARSAEQKVEELPPLAREVAEECGRLPLALAMAGSMAYEKGWEAVLESLRKADLEKIAREFPGYPYPDLLKALEASVNDLSQALRERYLDMAVFPEEEAIPLEALGTLWNLKRVEAEAAVIALEQAALLRWDADYLRVTLHDLQRDYLKKRREGELPALHSRLVDNYRAKCEGGEWHRGADDRYYFGRLCYHLKEAGREAELRELLLDFRWMEARLAHGGINALLSDYDYLPEDEEARLAHVALLLSSHVLVKDSNQLAGQLYGRLLTHREEKPGLKKLLAQSEQNWKRPRLLPISPSLTQAGGQLLRTLLGHTNSVRAVAFSPDGKYALSASNDTTLKLWDWQQGKRIRIFEGHTRGVTAVAFSPDGKFALSTSLDNTLKVWDWQSGKEIRSLAGHTNSVNAVAFSPDSKYALSASSDNTLKLWDWQTGLEIRTLEGHTDWVRAVAFSPDGKYALSTSSDTTLKLWDWQQGKEIRSLEGHIGAVTSVAFSPDGKFALSGSGDSSLKLWDWQNGKEIHTLEGHTDLVSAVTFSPDGKYALSASWDNTLKLWNWQQGKEIRTLRGHFGVVNAVAFSPDGKFALSASSDVTLRLWDWQQDTEYSKLNNHNYEVNAVVFSPDNKYALSASRDTDLKLWDWQQGKELRTFKGHTGGVTAMAFSPDGKYVLAASGDTTLKLWDCQQGKRIRSLKGHTQWVNAVAFSPDGKYALSASTEATFILWDWQNGTKIRILKGYSGLVTAVAFSPDGKFALSASRDNNLKLWDLQNETLIRTLEGHTSLVNAVTFSPDGSYALSASDDNTLKLWDWQQGKEIRTLKGHRNRVNGVVFSPNGKFILSACDDKTLKLWDWQNGLCLASFNLEGAVQCCAFAPDGRTVAAGDAVGQVYFLRLEE